jgi:hypothetical protein
MKRRLAILLCALALSGCRSFKVNAFGVPLNATAKESMSSDLTTEEKLGVLLLVGIAVAGIAVGVAAAN